MNSNELEALSALVDDQLQEGESGVLQELIGNEPARRRWGRYFLISDCLKGELPRYVDPGLADRIAIAIRREPVMLATRTPLPAAILKPLAGLAIAASVAALAIVGIQLNHGGSAPAPTAQVTFTTGPQTEPEGAFRLASGHPGAEPARPQLSNGRLPSSRLNRYLVNYNEFRSNAAVQGMLPYVRIVAHERDE
jgi:sigma-E factor negative regulatory protein RseA